MAVEYSGEIYLCKVCGNEVEVKKVGGGTLKCCSRNMKRTAEKTQTTTVLPENMPASGPAVT